MISIKIETSRWDMKRMEASSRAAIYMTMKNLWLGAAKAFVMELFSSIYTTSDRSTGMSQASILPLAANVGLRNELSARILGKSSKKIEKYGEIKGQFSSFSGTRKSQAAGMRAGADAFTFNLGNAGYQRFAFSFSIPVFQYFLHESSNNSSNNFSGSHGWDSMESAEKAFMTYIDDNYKRLFDEAFDYFKPFSEFS